MANRKLTVITYTTGRSSLYKEQICLPFYFPPSYRKGKGEPGMEATLFDYVDEGITSKSMREELNSLDNLWKQVSGNPCTAHLQIITD